MPRVYIRSIRVVLCTKQLHFVSLNWRIENYFCSMLVQLYENRLFGYPKSLNSRINEAYVFFNKIKRYLIEKKTLTSFITVCFAATTLVIVLTWFLCRQCHVIYRQRHIITSVIKEDHGYRCTSVV